MPALFLECAKCAKKGRVWKAQSIRGWKAHQSKTHNGYTDEELTAMLGDTVKSSEQGKIDFLAEVDTTSTLETGAEPAATAPTTPAASMKTDAVSRKLSGKMNKFKKTVAEKFPQIVSNALKNQPESLQLSDDDRELLTEGVENSLDVLEVDFQVSPISKTLTSPWWALIFPLFALLMIIIPRLPAIAEVVKARNKKELESREPVQELATN